MQFPKTKQTEVTNRIAMQLFSDFGDNVPVIALSGAKYNRAFEAIYKAIGEAFPESTKPEPEQLFSDILKGNNSGFLVVL